MIRRFCIPLAVLLLVILILPVNAHVPVSAGQKSNISTAFPVENPAKSYVMYGSLSNAGDVAYYEIPMHSGDHLVLSLLNNGYDKPVPDMIVMGPGIQSDPAGSPFTGEIPPGEGSIVIKGHPPLRAEYEPFGPGVTYEVANYSRVIDTAGTYYVAVVSPGETHYRLAVGYLEEFTPAEWVLVPFSVIETRLSDGQSILEILAPFIGIVVIGFVLIGRRVQRQGRKPGIAFWFASVGGLLCLGGAAITFVQMLNAVNITGYTPGVFITLVFIVIPAALGLSALRIARQTGPRTLRHRAYLLIIGIAGILFWAGFVIGPVFAIVAAIIPDR
jgi:hypothetical protein